MEPAAAHPLRLRPLWIACGWAIVAAILWLSLTPAPPHIDLAHGDKLGHFAAYAALMFWFCGLYAARHARLGYAVGFVLLGVAIEFAQRATGYRSFELLDMAADALGVLAGWGCARLAGPAWLARAEAALSRRPR